MTTSTLAALNAAHFRDAAIERAACDAWENDHTDSPWALAPLSVQDAMRGLVTPVVDSTLTAVAPALSGPFAPFPAAETDTYPDGTPFDRAVTWTVGHAHATHLTVRHVLRGVPLIAHPSDTWQDVANRYTEAEQEQHR